MEQIKRTVMCGLCGDSTRPQDELDIDVDDHVLVLPIGWLHANVIRTAPNPEWEAPRDVDEILSEMTQGFPGGPAEKAAAMAMFRPMAESSAESQNDVARFVQEDVDIHLCAKCAPKMVALDTHVFDRAGWEVN